MAPAADDREPAPVPTPQPCVYPRDPEEFVVAQSWSAVLGRVNLSVRDDFFALGGTSLEALRVVQRLQHDYGPAASLDAFFRNPTIEAFAAVLRPAASLDAGSVAVMVRAGGGSRPLFGVHDVMGDVAWMYPVAHGLPTPRPAFAFQPPGLYDGREPLRSVEDMARVYLQEVRRLQPDGPYLLSGYCTGGIVALEMARRLRADGQDVALVALLSSLPWDGPWRERFVGSVDIEDVLYREFVTQEDPVPRAVFSRMSRTEQLEYALEGWKDIDLAPPDVGPDFIQRFVDGYERNARAVACHDAAPYDGKVCLLMPQEHELGRDDARGAWAPIASGDFQVHPVPGNHFTFVEQPQVAEVAFRLEGCIAESEHALNGARRRDPAR